MGRYYNGDVNGKFMFAVQGSDAHERFGAVEEESNYINYVVYRDSYAEICAELYSIDKSSIEKVDKMFNENSGYNEEIKKEFEVSEKDLSEYADYEIGMQLKEFFDENPDCYECRFDAEI
jgi:gamma-glutamylcyclotransferase (GGCT)/AIG2-like uncharacterized protein YtfP